MPNPSKCNFLRLLLIGGSLAFASCSQEPTPIVERQESLLAFGTFVDVTLIDLSDEEAQLVMNKIRHDLDYFQYAFHPRKAGPTGRTNQLLAAAGEFTANPSLLPIIEKSRRLSAESDGLFNPAIGQLMRLWGFQDDIPPEGPPPDPEAIQQWVKANPSMSDLTLKGVRIRNSNSAVRLDFIGIARGYVLDELLLHIQAMGVQNARINIGSDLKVLGEHGDHPWEVQLRNPRNAEAIAKLQMQSGEAVFTLSDNDRSYEVEGKRYHDILDPRSGYPAEQTQSVTVVHHDGALANAAATALFVAGPTHWLAIARAMGIDQAMLIDHRGRIMMTQSLAQRLTFETSQHNLEVVELH